MNPDFHFVLAIIVYTAAGCKLIDTENISLPNQNINLLASERSERVTSFIFCRAG
jgi:hypothetical protein